MQQKTGLVWPFVLCLVLPLVAAWFAYPTTHVPPGYGIFPPEFVQAPPPFNLLVFLAVLAVELVFAVFLLFPTKFGFKPVDSPPAPALIAYPIWFWIGAVFTLFFWWLMWEKVTVFGDLVYYAFTPLWWGFILVLDGLVYRRNQGSSLLSKKPKTVFISSVVSVFGWYFFEYYNYFALGNWYYPNGHMAALPHSTIVFLFLIAYTTVWPAVFEWYTLLNTFPRLVARYSQGPKISIPGNWLIWPALAAIFVMVFYPYPLFWVLWIGPLFVLSGALINQKVWTPFTALAEGNWSPLLLVAIGSLFNGFFWEVWNYGSAHPQTWLQTNPNYWIYDIPYVNVIHIYAEMPLLGYFGYMPFGLLVWIVFIWAGQLFNFDTSLDLSETKPSLLNKLKAFVGK
jgi:hypothetical protein